MIELADVGHVLTVRFGLPVQARTMAGQDGTVVSVRPEGVEKNRAFTIRYTLAWRSLSAEFTPERFAAKLVQEMGLADDNQRAAFLVFARSAGESGAALNMQINGSSAAPLEPASWPVEWQSLNLRLRKPALPIDPAKPETIRDRFFPWAARFFGMVAALLPLEAESGPAGEEEGAVVERNVRQYERSKINRAACIEIHGTACSVCGMQFGEVYGDLGEGYIEVHHLLPVSELGGTYIIDPAEDLVPVCANCHAMLHRRDPPLHVAELQSYLNCKGPQE